MIGEMILILLVVLAAGFDLLQRKIPNVLVAIGVGCGIVWRGILWGGLPMMAAGILGMLIPAVLLWVPFSFRMIGAGDIKLFSMIGAWAGPSGILWVMLWSFVWGAGLSLILMIIKGNLKERFRYLRDYLARYLRTREKVPYMKKGQSEGTICFAIPVFLGLLTSLYSGCVF